MVYETAKERLSASYPFGDIHLLDDVPAAHVEPTVTAGAEVHTAAAASSKIIFSERVTILRGKNKMTADGEGNLILVGRNTSFENSLIQVNGRNCVVVIGDDCRIRGLKIVVRREGSMVIIGSKTTWESGAIISESGDIVALGNDCMVSNSVVLRTSDGHTIFDAATRQPINRSADVMIGSHVWLGNSSRVNKGSRIGAGTVIGQCSIASGTIEGNSIYAGVPARKVREGIVWSRTPRYEDIPEQYLP